MIICLVGVFILIVIFMVIGDVMHCRNIEKEYGKPAMPRDMMCLMDNYGRNHMIINHSEFTIIKTERDRILLSKNYESCNYNWKLIIEIGIDGKMYGYETECNSKHSKLYQKIYSKINGAKLIYRL